MDCSVTGGNPPGDTPSVPADPADLVVCSALRGVLFLNVFATIVWFGGGYWGVGAGFAFGSLIALGLGLLHRSGYRRFVPPVFMGIGAAFTALMQIVLGGVAGPLTLFWPGIAAVAAVVLGKRGAYALAGVGIVWNVVLVGLEALELAPVLQAGPIPTLLFLGVLLLVMARILGQGAAHLRHAIQVARLHEASAQKALDLRNREVERRGRIEKRLQDALAEARQANKAKSQFLASMSHELRTPLNAIIGYAEILEEEAAVDSEEAHDLGRIRTAGKHLLSLINDVLDLSKIEAGRMTLMPSQVDLDELVRETLETVMPVASGRGNRVLLDAGPLGSVFADGMRVRQVLLNLLSNASKFTENGEVVLRARTLVEEGKGFVEFQVQDNGIGISKAHQSKLFRPFTQADGSTSRKYGGTGLGLALSRRFVDMMEGTIGLESEPGVGTTVTFRLPTRTQASALESLAARRVQEARELTDDRPIVLCIDDESSALHLLDRMLREEGVHPVPCVDPTTAIALALEIRPKVITLDLHMPNLDGAELLQLLKRHEELADIPVVVVSIDGAASNLMDIGAAAWMRKPIDRTHLLSLIEGLGRDLDSPVLVVDDDGPTRDVLVRMLDAGGINTVEARDGKEALGLLESIEPRLILLDLMMPEMDGFQVAEALRKDPRWADLPVVVLTSATLDDEDRKRLERCTTVLTKSEETLRNLVAEVKRVA